MGSITERSFGVPEAVVSGQPVDFAYPGLTSVVPASVAVVTPSRTNPR